MNEKIYLIAAHPGLPFDLGKFHLFITTRLYPDFASGWWHYLSGPVYMVRTNLNANQLSSLLKQHMGNLQYIVIRVDPDDAQGWISREGWQWLGRA